MARIGIVAYGSRGDVQPMAALAKRLEKAGHRVKLLASIAFKDWLEGLNLEVVASETDWRELHHTDTGYRIWECGGDPEAMRHLIVDWCALIGHGPNEAIIPFADDVDLLISATAHHAGAAVAEKLRIPHVCVSYFPSAAVETDAAGHSRLKSYIPPDPYSLNYLRRDLLGLPPKSEAELVDVFSRTPVLHAYSPYVGVHEPGWPDHFHTTGYFFLDTTAHWNPPDDLQAFINDGTPPVVIGFSSITVRDTESFTDMIVDAVQQTGERAILLAGWAELGKPQGLPDNIFCTADAPHDWLLPRAAAVVNHSGAGSVAAALRAGVPVITVPFSFDQFFWSGRVAALGVGPDPLPSATLTRESLAAAIETALTDNTMRHQARETGERLRAEDGPGHAVSLIEDRLQTAPIQ